MGKDQEPDAYTRIIAVVLELLAENGYDGVQLRTVASRAHVSLTKVYKLFPTRDELIVSALEQWMTEHTYAEVAPVSPGESVRDAMTRVLRCVFEPWEKHPTMLEAYHHARTAPGGHRLDVQGVSAILPIAEAALRDLDQSYIEDIALILPNMVMALIARFAGGTLEITAILPILERTVYRLTADNESAATTRSATPTPQHPALANISTTLGQMGTRQDGSAR
ncbi:MULTISPECIES: TetR family transcriptional regulator [unclassified Nocardia]|uniref:TetR family transcriptional regulator n=1 Tax=unclassified Nocardia TaxID=2637762 RepID=UPI0035DB956F